MTTQAKGPYYLMEIMGAGPKLYLVEKTDNQTIVWGKFDYEWEDWTPIIKDNIIRTPCDAKDLFSQKDLDACDLKAINSRSFNSFKKSIELSECIINYHRR